MKTMRMSDFEKLVRESSDLNILDVRGRDAFRMGHVAGAVNIPLDELQGKIKELDQAAEYYIICYSGNFSGMAAEFLTRNGFKASNIQGGMGGYRGAIVS